MSALRKSTVCLLFVLLAVAGLNAQGRLTDPYEILNLHIDAIGGLDRVKAEKSNYSEGTLELVGTGLQGPFKGWGQYPGLSRQEVDLTVIQSVTGDNGEYSWSVDANGKIQIQKDEATLKRRELARHGGDYEYLNPNSEIFTVTFEGTEKVGDIDCYVIKMTNSINDDNSRLFINRGTFMLEKREENRPDDQEHTLYSDYRDINGLMLAFRQETTVLPIGQQLITQIDKYESNVEIDPSLFEPPAEDVRDFEFVNGTSAENIPFEFIENHIYLKVNINGKERLWVLDSGAGKTVIDIDFARKLGLNVEGNIKGRGVGKTIDVSFVTLPPCSIEGVRLNEQKIVTIAITGLFQKTLGIEVDGILGYDFLSRFVTRVDYANETLSLYDPETFVYEGEGVVMDVPLSGNFFTPEVTVDGQYTGLWNLDLGAGGHSFHYPFAVEHKFHDRTGYESMGFGAGGASKDKVLRFDSIEFAGFTIEKPVIDVPAQAGEGAFAGQELIGNLGNTLFRHFVLYLDYARQQVIVEKGADFGKDFPLSKSGLQVLMSDNGDWEVFFVSPGTPADEAGLKQGDIVTAVNGVGVEYLDGLIAFRKMMREKAGTQYLIAILREGEPKEIKLTLKDLL